MIVAGRCHVASVHTPRMKVAPHLEHIVASAIVPLVGVHLLFVGAGILIALFGLCAAVLIKPR